MYANVARSVITRAKPTCAGPAKTPKQSECAIERATNSSEMPVAQYEAVRYAWIARRSNADGSVVMRNSLRVHAYIYRLLLVRVQHMHGNVFPTTAINEENLPSVWMGGKHARKEIW